MVTKVFQQGNFIIVDKDSKENPIAIDSFDYDFTTPSSVKLKDTAEGNEINAATADLQKENGDPINSEALAKAHFATFAKTTSTIITPPTGGDKPQSSRLVNPSSVVFSGFRYLAFSCDGANDAITVTQDGNAVTYPHPNADGSLIRGFEIPLLTNASVNSITFNGTGTVDVLKID